MLPVVGQTPSVKPPEHEPHAPHDEGDSCSDGCCSEAAPETVSGTPKTRRANLEVVEVHEGDTLRGSTLKGLQRTVVRVEGMDCASCAATVEKGVDRLPGVHRATVNIAAGRLDAEHDPGLTLEELEDAVRAAGYGVAKADQAERPPFWRTPRALFVFVSALFFVLGLALSLVGA